MIHLPASSRPTVGRLVTACLVAATLVSAAAGADDPKASDAKATKKALKKKAAQKVKAADAKFAPGSPQEALAILRDLRELSEAVRRDREEARAGSKPADTASVLKALGRPDRTVTPPTLTSVGLDELLDKALAAAKAPPVRRTTDEEFVRRVCLDATGKLPTAEQVKSFLNSKKPDKRSELIDWLLESPDFGQNLARYWRDAVAYHATNQQARFLTFPALEEWLAEQFNKNRPWDEIARSVITANGKPAENGPAVFLVAHADTGKVPAEEVAGEVSRIFMGVQIACAQCHDHPSDVWKREQFHQFAAFFPGIRFNRRPAQPADAEIFTQPRASHKLPDAKDPAKPGTEIEPKFFLASSETPVPKGLTAQQKREVAASYVTGQDNPWFAKAFVNHAWRQLMGEGFYNPVDDMGPSREAKYPELLDALADQFAKGGYDVKWLYRTILNTNGYQREGRATNTEAGRIAFASNCPSRLRADVIFDALDQALGLSQFARGRAAAEGVPKKAAGPLAQLAGRGPRALFNLLYGVDPAVPNDDVMGTIPQALMLMNGPIVNRAIRADRATVLGKILADSSNDRDALEAVYLRVLARRPNDKERELCLAYIARTGNRREAFEDILWSLINSTEFLSRR